MVEIQNSEGNFCKKIYLTQLFSYHYYCFLELKRMVDKLTSTASASSATASGWAIPGHMSFFIAIITGHFPLLWTISGHVTRFVAVEAVVTSALRAIPTERGEIIINLVFLK